MAAAGPESGDGALRQPRAGLGTPITEHRRWRMLRALVDVQGATDQGTTQFDSARLGPNRPDTIHSPKQVREFPGIESLGRPANWPTGPNCTRRVTG